MLSVAAQLCTAHAQLATASLQLAFADSSNFVLVYAQVLTQRQYRLSLSCPSGM